MTDELERKPQEFRRVWRELAENGDCDSLDSAEYRRVFREWLQADCPDPLGFILCIPEFPSRETPGERAEGDEASDASYVD
jgi:hypothetical protein